MGSCGIEGDHHECRQLVPKTRGDPSHLLMEQEKNSWCPRLFPCGRIHLFITLSLLSEQHPDLYTAGSGRAGNASAYIYHRPRNAHVLDHHTKQPYRSPPSRSLGLTFQDDDFQGRCPSGDGGSHHPVDTSLRHLHPSTICPCREDMGCRRFLHDYRDRESQGAP